MMPLANGQVQVRDLVMGPGTAYEIVRGFNPFNRSVRADQGGARAWNHGSWSGVEWMNEAVIPLYILVEGAGDANGAWLAAHQQLMAAFRPVGEDAADVELRFAMAGSEFVMYGRPRLVEPDLTTLHAGLTVTQAAFVALDPLVYSGTEVVAGPFGLPVFSGGLTVPITVPFTVTGVMTSGFADLTNPGSADTSLRVRIDGPATQPRFTLEHEDGTVQTLRMTFDLAAGEWLDIDCGAKTVLLNGTVSRRGQTTGEFPTLPAGGPHRITFRASTYNDDATLTARFRPAYW